MINFTKWIELYGELYEISPIEEQFYSSLCNEFPQHAKALNIEAGLALLPSKLAYKYDVTVTDSCKEFIRHISTKQTNTEVQPPTFHIDSAEVARYLGKNFFNVIFCINSRLIFLKEKSVIEKLISDAKTLLSEDGYLVFDLINFARYDISGDTIEIPSRKTETISLSTEIINDKENNIYKLNQRATLNGGETVDIVKDEQICVLTKDAIKEMAEKAGFSSIEFYSDYDKTPYSEDSYKVICLLKK